MVSPKTILIVDDQAVVRKVIAGRLGKSGYRVLMAPGGRDGLAMARREHPDLVILDLMMPDMEGGEVAQELHDDEATREIPVIFLTALLPKQAHPNEAGPKSRDLMLPKEHKAEELLELVHRLIG